MTTTESRVLKDRYRLDCVLGKGGMGEVYRGTDLQLDRAVAIKLIQGHILKTESAEARFFVEAKACARIDSHHVVSVFDYGVTEDGERFLVLEYVEGRSLRQLIAEGGRLDAAFARSVAVQICRALQACHDTGVVHRDLKPGNVMLTQRDGNDRFVKVLDFGVAKILDGEEITRTGAIVGTADYMAPELVKGERIDGRADIYALGVMLYRLVTGTRIFKSSSSVPGYHNVYTEPEPPRQRAPDADIPPNLEQIIMKCLAKEPAARFQSMNEVAAALDALDLEDTSGAQVLPSLSAALEADEASPTSATPLPQPQMSETLLSSAEILRPAGTGRGLAMGLAGGLVLLLVAGATWLLTQEGEPPLDDALGVVATDAPSVAPSGPPTTTQGDADEAAVASDPTADDEPPHDKTAPAEVEEPPPARAQATVAPRTTTAKTRKTAKIS